MSPYPLSTASGRYLPIAFLNKSSLVTDAEASAIAQACNLQLQQDIAPAWAMVPRACQFVPSSGSVPSGSTVLVFVDDDDPNAPDALAYHTENDDGSIYAPIFVKKVLGQPGARVLWDVSCSASHEVAELFADAQVDVWVDGLDGYSYALEIADPVEGDVYGIDVGGIIVGVSNFVTPAWFDDAPPGGSRFDHMGNLGMAFQVGAGGYVVRRQATGQAEEIFGEKCPEEKRQNARWRRRVRRA